MIKPILEQIQEEYGGKLNLAQINTDENQVRRQLEFLYTIYSCVSCVSCLGGSCGSPRPAVRRGGDFRAKWLGGVLLFLLHMLLLSGLPWGCCCCVELGETSGQGCVHKVWRGDGVRDPEHSDPEALVSLR